MRKLLEPESELNEVTDRKAHVQQLTVLYTRNEQLEIEIFSGIISNRPKPLNTQV